MKTGFCLLFSVTVLLNVDELWRDSVDLGEVLVEGPAFSSSLFGLSPVDLLVDALKVIGWRSSSSINSDVRPERVFAPAVCHVLSAMFFSISPGVRDREWTVTQYAKNSSMLQTSVAKIEVIR